MPSNLSRLMFAVAAPCSRSVRSLAERSLYGVDLRCPVCSQNLRICLAYHVLSRRPFFVQGTICNPLTSIFHSAGWSASARDVSGSGKVHSDQHQSVASQGRSPKARRVEGEDPPVQVLQTHALGLNRTRPCARCGWFGTSLRPWLRTPASQARRSTYTGTSVSTESAIRSRVSGRTKEARIRGWKPGRFSFNVAGGRS